MLISTDITFKIMKNITVYLLAFFTIFSSPLISEEKNKVKSDQQYNFFIGNFDFSDDKQAATLYGFQHQNESLERETFLGKVSPITGGFITENSAAYIYSGIEWNVEIGPFDFTPSFAPGLYDKGDGKDLGHIIEFKSEVQLSYGLSESTSFGASYNHVSNASIGDKNPGANSYMFNFLKNF